MQVFKFTFANNSILACTPFYGKGLEVQYSYEHYAGYLIYAMVKASSEEEAYRICQQIIFDFTNVPVV